MVGFGFLTGKIPNMATSQDDRLYVSNKKTGPRALQRLKIEAKIWDYFLRILFKIYVTKSVPIYAISVPNQGPTAAKLIRTSIAKMPRFIVVLMRIFFMKCRLNSIPPVVRVISSVETVNAGNVDRTPPQTGPASLAISTAMLMMMPLSAALPKSITGV